MNCVVLSVETIAGKLSCVNVNVDGRRVLFERNTGIEPIVGGTPSIFFEGRAPPNSKPDNFDYGKLAMVYDPNKQAIKVSDWINQRTYNGKLRC